MHMDHWWLMIPKERTNMSVVVEEEGEEEEEEEEEEAVCEYDYWMLSKG